MKGLGLISAAAALALSELPAAPAGAATRAPGASKAVNLDGERFSSRSALLTPHPTGGDPYCGATQQGSVEFQSEGSATGPYPGTFTESGQWDFDLITEQTFNARFTIHSGTRSIQGLISYEQEGAGAEGTSLVQDWGGCTWSQSGGPYSYCPNEAFAGTCSGQSVAYVGAEGVTQIFEHPTGRHHMEITEGNQQSAPVNSWFAQPLGVRVTDGLGAPVAGVVVRYLPGARKGPSAAPQGPWVRTDWEGNAAMNVQASPPAGSYTMLAKGAKGASATFSLTNAP